MVDVRGWVGAMTESISKLCSDFIMLNFLGTPLKFIGFSERSKRFLPIGLTILPGGAISSAFEAVGPSLGGTKLLMLQWELFLKKGGC